MELSVWKAPERALTGFWPMLFWKENPVVVLCSILFFFLPLLFILSSFCVALHCMSPNIQLSEFLPTLLVALGLISTLPLSIFIIYFSTSFLLAQGFDWGLGFAEYSELAFLHLSCGWFAYSIQKDPESLRQFKRQLIRFGVEMHSGSILPDVFAAFDAKRPVSLKS